MNTTALSACMLFRHISDTEREKILQSAWVKKQAYKKNQIIFQRGQTLTDIGIILSGAVQVVQEDIWGNRSVLAKIEEGGIFGEVFVCADIKSLPVSLYAAADSTVLLLDCAKADSVYTQRLLANMVTILAQKNLLLNQKIYCLSQRTIRDKLLTYLYTYAQKAGKPTFTIPLSRQELADYLCADRSAVSNALSKLRKEGIITFHKNHFTLYKTEE